MNKVERTLKEYQDILGIPRPVSKKRTQMLIADRAAQFAPFAAVVGHESAIKEAGRYTEQKRELDEAQKSLIDEKLREIDACRQNTPMVEIVFFEKDKNKPGGRYITKSGCIKRIDEHAKEILFTDGTRIDIEEVYSIVISGNPCI